MLPEYSVVVVVIIIIMTAKWPSRKKGEQLQGKKMENDDIVRLVYNDVDRKG